MTPDKVEAALGVLESARRVLASQDLREVLMNVQNNINSPACAGMANAALVRMDRLPDLREALSVLTEALAERGWRPIAEAPRDGTWVFGMHVAGNYKGRPFAMHSYDGQWVDGQWAVLNPTHFLPIPAMKETP